VIRRKSTSTNPRIATHGSFSHTDVITLASARPHLDHLKIGGQMDQIGAKAGLGPTDPVVDAQQSRRCQRRHRQRVGERDLKHMGGSRGA
jgi:hypothetical protein